MSDAAASHARPQRARPGRPATSPHAISTAPYTTLDASHRLIRLRCHGNRRRSLITGPARHTHVLRRRGRCEMMPEIVSRPSSTWAKWSLYPQIRSSWGGGPSWWYTKTEWSRRITGVFDCDGNETLIRHEHSRTAVITANVAVTL